MGLITGGQLLAKALKGRGVDYLFSLSGDLLNPLYDACLDQDLRIVDCRHEQAALHMAEGWARATGRIGVAAVTAGAALTNSMTGLANAFHCGSPLLLIAGRRPLAEVDRGAFGEQDQPALVSSVTKWARTVPEVARIPEYVAAAIRQARAGRPGPTFLEIDIELMEGGLAEPPLEPTPLEVPRPQGDPAQIERAVALLERAQRPIAIAGSGVWWAGAAMALRSFIEAAQMPLCTINLGRGVVPEDHPLCLGPFKAGLAEADLIMVIGTRLNWALNFGQSPLFNPQAAMIQVDIEASEIGRNRPVEVGIVGDARLVLEQLARAIAPGQDRTAWLRRLGELRTSFLQEVEGHAHSGAVPIHPLRLCREISEFLGREATLALDGGEIQIWASMALGAYRPGHWLDSGAFGCLGTGLPFALAARLARPKEQVLLLTGDGSFGFSAMELDTAVRHGLPIVVVIANDGAWGMIKHKQEEAYGRGRVVATELGYVRYDRLAEALGGYGELVERPAEIKPALERASAAGVPAVVNVKCAPDVESPWAKRFLA
jgi:acetolactate synthase-1/2/3 large subunit